MKTFAERLKELREEKELSIRDLAKILEISAMSISRWENNKADIKSEHLVKLAKFFDVSLDYLMGLED